MERPDEPFGSYLPIELWIKIMKHATECDLERGLLDCMLRSGPDPLEIGRLPFEQLCHSWNPKVARSRLDYSNRLSLALVSRTWHELMLPMLYHSIVLSTSLQLQHFAILLRDKPHLRRFVKVFGISKTGGYSWATSDQERSGRAIKDKPYVEEIYKYCTNLIAMDDHGYYCDIWSLGAEVNRGRKLQYLSIAKVFLCSHAEFYMILPSFDHLRFLAFYLGTYEDIPILHAPRLTLPRLEVLSLSTNEAFSEDVDRYFGEAVLPRLHTLQLTFQAVSGRQVNQLDRFQEIWKGHGHRIKTLMIQDQTKMELSRRDASPPPLSFQINHHLVNLQQLVVNNNIWDTLLVELATCSSISTLEISDVDSNSDVTEVVHFFRKDVYKWFINLQRLRLSVSPNLFGRELAPRQVVIDLERVIKQYRASIETRGVTIVSEISKIRGVLY